MIRGVEKLGAGHYRHAATGKEIVRTDYTYEGPNGGKLVRWEVMSHDRYGWSVDDIFYRLKDAIESLDGESA